MNRILKFGAVGFSGVGVNLLFVWVGIQMFSGLGPAVRDALASALGIGVSIVSNFALNDAWTWGDRVKGRRPRDLGARFGAFVVASGIGAGFQFGTAQLLALTLGMNIYLAQLCGIGMGSVANFVMNNFWTFQDQVPGPVLDDDGRPDLHPDGDARAGSASDRAA